MKTKFAILTFIILLGFSSVYAQNFQWAKQIGGTSSDIGRSIVVDAFGNVYTAGNFQGTVDFDPGAVIFNLTSAGMADVFVQKLDANGNFIWAKQIGGGSNDGISSVTVDAWGNVYTTGYFEGTADFDPGAAIFNLTSTGNYDIFVQKMDSNGNFIWAKQIGGVSIDQPYSLSVEDSANIYITGIFSGTVDFDPGTGTHYYTSAGSYDIFVLKLDSIGNFIWAKQMGGTQGDYGISIATDSFGNVYTTGHFSGTVDFDPGTTTFNLNSAGGSQDIVIQKMDANGNFLWAKQIGGTGNNDLPYDIAIDASGNNYITGIFVGNVDFDPGVGTTILTSIGISDIFVQKMDANGSFIWAKQMGGILDDVTSYSITLDALGNVYTVGHFNGTVDFDPASTTFNLTSAGNQDIFVQKMDSIGNFLWAKQMGGTSADYGLSIDVDVSGNIYTTGVFEGIADFDPEATTFNLTSAGNFDVFVQKLSPMPLPLKFLSFEGRRYNRINQLVWKTASEGNLNTYEVERSTDAKEFTTIATIKAYNRIAQTYTYDDKIEFTGELYYRLKVNENNGKFTYSEVVSLIAKIDKDIKIAPNPAKDIVAINTGDNSLLNTEAIILDSKGSIISTQLIQSVNQSINISALTQGIYLIKFANGEVQKLIKE